MVCLFFEAMQESTDYVVSYLPFEHCFHYYLKIYFLLYTLTNFVQMNWQNTYWDAIWHCFRLTLNKNETKILQKPYSRPVQ
jgi:hypothetical protein